MNLDEFFSDHIREPHPGPKTPIDKLLASSLAVAAGSVSLLFMDPIEAPLARLAWTGSIAGMAVLSYVAMLRAHNDYPTFGKLVDDAPEIIDSRPESDNEIGSPSPAHRASLNASNAALYLPAFRKAKQDAGSRDTNKANSLNSRVNSCPDLQTIKSKGPSL